MKRPQPIADLVAFKTLSKQLRESLALRASLRLSRQSLYAPPRAREQLDLTELVAEAKRHPDQPQNLYLLAEAYLKSGDIDNAKDTITQLDAASTGDYRALTGTGGAAGPLPPLRRRHHALSGSTCGQPDWTKSNSTWPTPTSASVSTPRLSTRRSRFLPIGKKDDAYQPCWVTSTRTWATMRAPARFSATHQPQPRQRPELPLASPARPAPG